MVRVSQKQILKHPNNMERKKNYVVGDSQKNVKAFISDRLNMYFFEGK